ncbi:MAG: carbonic anhydrase [Patescibacteria group bacterium]
MSHVAKAIVLRCMDYRFVSSLRDYLVSFGLKDRYDLVSVAGAAKNMVDPANPADPEFVMRQIDIAKRLHHIVEVIIINHLDCGAYGKIFASKEAERRRHEGDLEKAKAMIKARFLDLRVRLVLAGLHPAGGFRANRVGEAEEI